ncbi:MAG: butyrate kinase, partial [Muribaculaceae bacterium]|nr:butyrate kinase [Muribaculaceae bacterium]
MIKILAINPGSTSTKIAVYTDGEPTFTLSIPHPAEELAHFDKVVDQFDWRKNLIETALRDNGVDIRELSAVIGRGGIISPIESGVYEVTDALRHD